MNDTPEPPPPESPPVPALQFTALREELDIARSALSKANGLLRERDTMISALTSENGELKKASANFEMAVARRVVELGIRADAVTQPKPGKAVIPTGPESGAAAHAQSSSDGKPTATEKCAAFIAEHGPSPITSGYGLPK